jgi:hypothetical protein
MISDVPDGTDLQPPVRRAPRLPRMPGWLTGSSAGPIWIGLAIVTAGFVVLAITWGKVAGMLDVPFQLPYLLSGGAGGVAVVIAGLVVVHTSVRRREDARRERSLARLADRLAELRTTLAEREHR